MAILTDMVRLLTVALMPAVLYVLLMSVAAGIAMGSKKKFRRDMAWKIFNALVRRRQEPRP